MSEELIGLAFFDDAVSNAEKEAMVCRLGRPSVRNILKRLSQLPDDQTFNKNFGFCHFQHDAIFQDLKLSV